MKLIHYGQEAFFDPEKFEPIQNDPGYRFGNKPLGGFWSSPVDSNYGWKDYCKGIGDVPIEGDGFFVFELSPDAKILKIDSFADLANAATLESVHCKGVKVLDFEKLAKEYDAIWLTEKGEEETDLFPFASCSLQGWDCESVLVMSKEVIQPRKGS